MSSNYELSTEYSAWLETLDTLDLEAGDMLWQPGEPARLARLERGLLKIECQFADSTHFYKHVIEADKAKPADYASLVIVYAGVGDWVGYEGIGSQVNQLAVTAQTHSRVKVIEAQIFMDEAPREALNEALWIAGLNTVNMGVQRVVDRMDLRTRVLMKLSNLRMVTSLPELEVSQSDLASFVGIRRQNLSPILKELEAEGLVELGYKTVLIGEKTKIREAILRL